MASSPIKSKGSGDDEKYEKAARQSQRDMIGVVALVAIVVVVMLYFNSSSTPADASTTSKTMMRKPHEATALDVEERFHDQEAPPQKIEVSLAELTKRVQRLDETVRDIKARVDIFETDDEAQAAAKGLQDATRQLLHKLYGPHEPYRVEVTLEFQDTISDFAENGKDGRFLIELAPSSLQPHSIYTFLEVSRQWNSRKTTGKGGNGGAFHRIAPHVLQVMVRNPSIKHLAFQEYSPEYPHKRMTVGYAGRPSGPAWYVSMEDNTRNHGPGSQQKHNPYEADSCFGKVIQGFEESVVRISKVPGQGFLGDAKKHVLITEMQIQVPDASGTYHKWQDPDEL